MTAAPLILTLKMDAGAFARLDGLRQAHFPSERNHIPAHLTLFHHLDGERLDEIVADLVAAAPPVMALEARGLRKLGRGVAVEITGAALKSWRDGLAHRWGAELTAQDRQPFRAHVTVQNKVEPAQAHALYEALSSGWAPFSVTGEGALLWRYLGGPWALEAEVAFRPGP